MLFSPGPWSNYSLRKWSYKAIAVLSLDVSSCCRWSVIGRFLILSLQHLHPELVVVLMQVVCQWRFDYNMPLNSTASASGHRRRLLSAGRLLTDSTNMEHTQQRCSTLKGVRWTEWDSMAHHNSTTQLTGNSFILTGKDLGKGSKNHPLPTLFFFFLKRRPAYSH